jgi:hypothetical protein
VISRSTGEIVRVVLRIEVEVRWPCFRADWSRVSGGHSRIGPGRRPRICGSVSSSAYHSAHPVPLILPIEDPRPTKGTTQVHGADGAHHWHAPTSKNMSEDHRTGRLSANAARLAWIRFVRKSKRPRMSSRGLSMDRAAASPTGEPLVGTCVSVARNLIDKCKFRAHVTSPFQERGRLAVSGLAAQ